MQYLNLVGVLRRNLESLRRRFGYKGKFTYCALEGLSVFDFFVLLSMFERELRSCAVESVDHIQKTPLFRLGSAVLFRGPSFWIAAFLTGNRAETKAIRQRFEGQIPPGVERVIAGTYTLYVIPTPEALRESVRVFERINIA